MLKPFASLLLMTLITSAAQAAVTDPLRSPGWRWMEARYFEGQTVRFSDAVQVTAPRGAEDAMSVPVGVDASALEGVREILVFADLNPITTILRYFPEPGTPPVIGFRFKIQQASPIRAAVRTADGVWHVGGQWIDAAGGGCTAPSAGSASAAWQDRFGDMSAQWLPRRDGGVRLRTQIIHPMDTGLADGIPAFFIEETNYRAGDGRLLARLETFEPVSENPLITLDLPTTSRVVVDARDGQGNRFKAEIGR
jgi:sulfur-oxidizing protein SoxY